MFCIGRVLISAFCAPPLGVGDSPARARRDRVRGCSCGRAVGTPGEWVSDGHRDSRGIFVGLLRRGGNAGSPTWPRPRAPTMRVCLQLSVRRGSGTDRCVRIRCRLQQVTERRAQPPRARGTARAPRPRGGVLSVDTAASCCSGTTTAWRSARQKGLQEVVAPADPIGRGVRRARGAPREAARGARRRGPGAWWLCESSASSPSWARRSSSRHRDRRAAAWVRSPTASSPTRRSGSRA